MYSIMSSANMAVLLLLFQFGFLLFLFLLWFAMTGTSKTMLNKSGESGHPYLFPDLRGNDLVFHLRMNDVCCGFVIYGLFNVEVGSLCAHLLERFYHKWVLNVVESFLCIYWDDHMGFLLRFVNMVYHVDWLAYIEESLHPWNNPLW